jgi:phenylpropionate dioxygenase-like ring-hydroxylating dioxygenase large terminal subunit
MIDVDSLIDLKRAVQSKRIFWDQEIYELELERIFGRCWLFLTHESLIPNHGDFVMAKMAEDNVIVCRQKDGSLRAFINSCTHRGNQVCQAESGNTRSFVCNYHGWVFGTDGALLDIPLQERCHAMVDKSKRGLLPIRVESYGGFVYGCFSAEAPSLKDYLGEFGWYLDTWMVGTGSGVELVGPPTKSTLDCNWKVPTENFVGDAYHVGWTHAAALTVMGGELAGLSGNRADMPYDDLGIQVTTRYGHGFGYIDRAGSATHYERKLYDEYLAAQKPKVVAKLGAARGRLFDGHWNCSVFPNNSFLYGTNTFKVWHPLGPKKIEVWTWTIVHKDMDPELKRQVQKGATFSFGTAGLFEADDGDNMATCTSSNSGRTTRQGDMVSTMGMNNEGPHPEYPGIVGSSFIGETSYRGFYRFYKEIMSAPDWAMIRRNDAQWDAIWTNREYWSNRGSAT